MPPANLTPLNDREYRKLLLTLTLNAQQLELLVAITDDRNLQDQLITAYEADLKAQGIAPLRARLDPKRPSLRATLEELVAQTPALKNGEPAVVTVLNAGELLGVRLSDDKSEQEKFFFSLQWTREALRNFEFPIVLWLPDAVATRLAQQAPDFWSWRGGVFEFVAEARVPERGATLPMPSRDMAMEAPSSPVASVAIDDLQQQVTQLEQTASESPLLITLYNNLGEAYEGKYDNKQALELYEKALILAQAKSDPAGQARSLRNLGDALRKCGRPLQALDYYQQALGKYRGLGDRNGEAATLNQLGNAYQSLGQYQQAMEYHQQSLVIKREIGDRQGEAASLGNLGNAYQSLGQYQQAIEYHQQSLVIKREIGDRHGEAISLFNLGHALARVDEKWNARQAYAAAKALYQDMGLQQKVADCDQALYDLAQMVVVEPKQAPTIGEPPPQEPDWLAKSMPTPTPSPPSARPQKLPVTAWFLVGVGLAGLLWWLLR